MKCPRIALRPWEATTGTERVNRRCLAEAKVQMSGMDPSGKRIKGQCGNCLTRNYILDEGGGAGICKPFVYRAAGEMQQGL